jgi:hypothetical protein
MGPILPECVGPTQDVRAIEAPQAIIKRGEYDGSITQYRVDKKTGETSFCSHGGYCFPTHVMQRGKKIEALRLTNCTIGKRPKGKEVRCIVRDIKRKSRVIVMMQLLVAFLLASVDIGYASDQAGFIFTADEAVNPWNEKESIRILERLPVAELKKRFARYKVDVTAGEDCAICATISRGKVSLSVYYDENGIVVINISSNGPS